MTKVSVILTSYNHSKYITETIESILNQGFTDYELIIIDDKSSDNSVDIIKTFQDKRIKFITHENNMGMVTTVNEAIKLSKGQYIAHINSDDIWCDKNKLDKQIKILDENQQYKALFTKANITDENGKILPERDLFFKENNRSRHEWLRYFFFYGNCLCYPSAVIRREIFEEIGFYDPRYSILLDLDMWIRICKKYDIYLLEDKTVNFREGDHSASYRQSNLSNHEMMWVLKNYFDISYEEFKAIFKEEIANEKEAISINDSNYITYMLKKALLSKVTNLNRFAAINFFDYMDKFYPELNLSYKDFTKYIKSYVDEYQRKYSESVKTFYFISKKFFRIIYKHGTLRIKFLNLPILNLKLKDYLD